MTGGQLTEHGDNEYVDETVSIASQQYHLQFRLQGASHGLGIHEGAKSGTKPKEKSAREQIARVLMKEDQS